MDRGKRSLISEASLLGIVGNLNELDLDLMGMEETTGKELDRKKIGDGLCAADVRAWALSVGRGAVAAMETKSPASGKARVLTVVGVWMADEPCPPQPSAAWGDGRESRPCSSRSASFSRLVALPTPQVRSAAIAG